MVVSIRRCAAAVDRDQPVLRVIDICMRAVAGQIAVSVICIRRLAAIRPNRVILVKVVTGNLKISFRRRELPPSSAPYVDRAGQTFRQRQTKQFGQ